MGKGVGRRFLKFLKERPYEIKDDAGEVLQSLDFVPRLEDFKDESVRQAFLDHSDELEYAFRERFDEFFGPEQNPYNRDGEQLSLRDFDAQEVYNSRTGRYEFPGTIRPEMEFNDRYYAKSNYDYSRRQSFKAAEYEKQIAEGEYDDYYLNDMLYNDIYNNTAEYIPPPSEDEIMRLAREAQDRDLRQRNAQPLPATDETQFQVYQRVNKNMAYEELKVYTPGADIQGGHFDRAQDLASHARTEFHMGYEGADKTQLLLESQSDYAKKMTEMRRRNAKAGRPDTYEKKTPWESGGVYNRANVAAAMYRGALKGMEWFSWSSPLNRNRRAHLHADPATRGYGREIPEWVRKVYDHFGEEIEVQYWTPENTVDAGGYANPEGYQPGDQQFIRVRVSPRMRELIKKHGVSALGLGAVAIGQATGGEDE
jgi:hypothetical protein